MGLPLSTSKANKAFSYQRHENVLCFTKKENYTITSRLPITQITGFKETAKERRKKFLPSPPLFQSFVVKSAEAIFFPWEIIVIKIKENEKGLTQSYSTNEGSKSVKSSQAHQQHLQFI